MTRWIDTQQAAAELHMDASVTSPDRQVKPQPASVRSTIRAVDAVRCGRSPRVAKKLDNERRCEDRGIAP